MPPPLVGDESLHAADLKLLTWGIPNAASITNSNGPGKGGGMGNRRGTGIGNDGDGPGLDRGKGGGCCGDVYHLVSGASEPVCLYCPRPEYSDLARRVKYQGHVLVSAVILADGSVGDIEIIKSPGLDLDQKVLEAVRTWRFKPWIGPGGKPAAVRVPIEVMFQLF
ncbi:MAG: energy transducer TonB [Bryobacteraceae bacterium]